MLQDFFSTKYSQDHDYIFAFPWLALGQPKQIVLAFH
jgi:hypothetical protein